MEKVLAQNLQQQVTIIEHKFKHLHETVGGFFGVATGVAMNGHDVVVTIILSAITGAVGAISAHYAKKYLIPKIEKLVKSIKIKQLWDQVKRALKRD